MKPQSVDLYIGAFLFDHNTHFPEDVYGGKAVSPCQKTAYMGDALSQGSEHDAPV